MQNGGDWMEEFECARDECDIVSVRKKHNQKYCSDECCRLATNKRIMKKYYDRRDQRMGKIRYCNICGTTQLSRYNNSQTCAPCVSRRQVEANTAVAEMLRNGVSIG